MTQDERRKLKEDHPSVAWAKARSLLCQRQHSGRPNLCGYDALDICGVAKTILSLLADLEKAEAAVQTMREALEYYSKDCRDGCSPCDHLMARAALEAVGKGKK